MNPSASATTDSHQQIQLLLPWYMNQSLQPAERQRVESHIRHCLPCRRELVSLKKLAEAVTEKSDLDMAAEMSFSGLRAKLPARTTGNVQTLAPAKVGIPGKLAEFSHRNGVRLALAASLLMAIMPFIQHKAPTDTADNYRTLSAARPEPANGKHLRVVFAKSLSSTEIAAILTAIHGQRTDEANSVGAFTIRLNNDENSPKPEDAIALLRSRPDVLLAEPVAHP